jgi:hypothetical protein
MELADPRLISQLTEAYNVNATRSKRSLRPRMTTNRPAPGERGYQPAGKSRRCSCGTCRACKENARWERIFAEKFADPAYYSGLAIRHESPLHTI